MTAASKFNWCEKGSRADNGGFVSAKMTARKRSFFTILFAQHTHDTNGIRARKRKAKRCIWDRNLSFGLLYYASWLQFPTEAKRVSFALSVPRMVNSLQGLAFVRQKRPFVCHALRVFANRFSSENSLVLFDGLQNCSKQEFPLHGCQL